MGAPRTKRSGWAAWAASWWTSDGVKKAMPEFHSVRLWKPVLAAKWHLARWMLVMSYSCWFTDFQ